MLFTNRDGLHEVHDGVITLPRVPPIPPPFCGIVRCRLRDIGKSAGYVEIEADEVDLALIEFRPEPLQISLCGA